MKRPVTMDDYQWFYDGNETTKVIFHPNKKFHDVVDALDSILK